MDVVHKHEYHVRDLGTRSVTLFPSRAQVVREIKDVPLKPGINEITVIGFTPTCDADSVNVEGTGSAVISDITTELLPNREIFEDIYPESDHGSDESDDDNDPFYKSDSEKDEDAELKEVRAKLVELRDEYQRAKEVIASSEARLRMLELYGRDAKPEGSDAIKEHLETYHDERAKNFENHMQGIQQERDVARRIEETVEEEKRLVKIRQEAERKAWKEKNKALKAKEKEEQMKRRREAEREKEKLRIRRERQHFWPKLVGSVRITLDANAMTPMSSRRGSIASATELVDPGKKSPETADDDAGPLNCDLVLSYLTSSAFWSPHYDLQLSTTTNTATLLFDAKLTNATSETWSNCKVTLSTSQASSWGLGDALPTLEPWRIKLGESWGAKSGSKQKVGGSFSDVLTSQKEYREMAAWKNKQKQVAQPKARGALFGVPKDNDFDFDFDVYHHRRPKSNRALARRKAPDTMADGTSNPTQRALAPPATSSPQFWSSEPAAFDSRRQAREVLRNAGLSNQATTSGFGGNTMRHGTSIFGLRAPAPAPAQAPADRERDGRDRRNPFVLDEEGDQIDFDRLDLANAMGNDGTPYADAETGFEPLPELEFQESAIEETGLTTTYDLPGLKTLAPRTTPSKQRVARVTLPNVVFSHTVVAKYQPAAYLKALLRNSGKLALLKGPAGLTLDGTFLGRTTLPRCSVGDTVTLSLGVDPAVKIVYPAPEVRRATTGVFSKEACSAYTRSVTVANTRAASGGGKTVHLVVLDQVPISEDERLRVDILQPKGMAVGDDAGVAAGVPGREARGDKEWGRATAKLKTEGEVCWDVSVNPGKAVKLALEYVVAVPSGEHAVQC